MGVDEPGVTSAPPRSSRDSASGPGPLPTAATTPSSTSTQPRLVLGAGLVHDDDVRVGEKPPHASSDTSSKRSTSTRPLVGDLQARDHRERPGTPSSGTARRACTRAWLPRRCSPRLASTTSVQRRVGDDSCDRERQLGAHATVLDHDHAPADLRQPERSPRAMSWSFHADDDDVVRIVRKSRRERRSSRPNHSHEPAAPSRPVPRWRSITAIYLAAWRHCWVPCGAHMNERVGIVCVCGWLD